jgi:hypothetical protein
MKSRACAGCRTIASALAGTTTSRRRAEMNIELAGELTAEPAHPLEDTVTDSVRGDVPHPNDRGAASRDGRGDEDIRPADPVVAVRPVVIDKRDEDLPPLLPRLGHGVVVPTVGDDGSAIALLIPHETCEPLPVVAVEVVFFAVVFANEEEEERFGGAAELERIVIGAGRGHTE